MNNQPSKNEPTSASSPSSCRRAGAVLVALMTLLLAACSPAERDAAAGVEPAETSTSVPATSVAPSTTTTAPASTTTEAPATTTTTALEEPATTGSALLAMGHSFFDPVAQAFASYAVDAGATGHEQVNVYAGNEHGAPEGLWNDPAKRAEGIAALETGDIDIVGLTYHPAYPTSAGYRLWIDEALTHNPNTSFFVAVPWSPFPTGVSAAEYSASWEAGLTAVENGLVAELRAAYPDTTIVTVPYGRAANELYLSFEAGELPELQLVSPNGDGVFSDDMGHAGPLLVERAAQLWFDVLYGTPTGS